MKYHSRSGAAASTPTSQNESHALFASPPPAQRQSHPPHNLAQRIPCTAPDPKQPTHAAAVSAHPRALANAPRHRQMQALQGPKNTNPKRAVTTRGRDRREGRGGGGGGR